MSSLYSNIKLTRGILGLDFKVTGHKTIQARKECLRQSTKLKLRMQADIEALSLMICGRVVEMAQYRAANLVCAFVSLPIEVQTFPLIRSVWSDEKELAVPCCMNGRLELYHLKSMEDLTPRTLGILEPRDGLRSNAERRVPLQRVELFVVPGVAFDPSGGRLGHGKRYYDQLLTGASTHVPKIALAFESQIVDEVPMAAHDVFMDYVVTEQRIYCRRMR